jgi:hypothetical protein
MTRQPITEAVVELLGTDGERFDVGVTDSVGAVPLSVPGAGQYQLRATHADYGTTLSDIMTFAADEWKDVRLFLGIDSYRLAPIEVVGTSKRAKLTRGQAFFDAHRRQSRGGRFITREEIAATGAEVVSEVFRQEEGVLTGLQLEGTDLVPTLRPMRGWGCIYTYLNLLRGGATPSFGGEPGPNIDTYLDVEMIAGIEFYREFNEVPREWVHFAWKPEENPMPCALLVIWTRAAW